MSIDEVKMFDIHHFFSLFPANIHIGLAFINDAIVLDQSDYFVLLTYCCGKYTHNRSSIMFAFGKKKNEIKNNSHTNALDMFVAFYPK